MPKAKLWVAGHEAKGGFKSINIYKGENVMISRKLTDLESAILDAIIKCTSIPPQDIEIAFRKFGSVDKILYAYSLHGYLNMPFNMIVNGMNL